MALRIAQFHRTLLPQIPRFYFSKYETYKVQKENTVVDYKYRDLFFVLRKGPSCTSQKRKLSLIKQKKPCYITISLRYVICVIVREELDLLDEVRLQRWSILLYRVLDQP
jgi:hypothetical protein